ncbi:MAG: cupin domain-containing protein [Pseudomonadota bacterium]
MPFTHPQKHLNGLSAEQFLAEYWQKKPLLIRGAFPEFTEPGGNPLSADELAGLALEEGIHSRLILGSHRDDRWKVIHGPLAEDQFAQLPDSHWSLLVSDVEKHLPDFAAWLEPFRFIPDWRIDDLMVSYAPEGGSVGKHTDEYDVFLLQTAGRRRWQIEERRSESPVIEGLELKLLQDFQPTQEWVLEPGDMLYLPPGIAHYGVSMDDDCMTWSVGFRAPGWASLALDLVDTVTASLDESQRYSDADLPPQENPAELSAESTGRVRRELEQLLNLDPETFQSWLGRAVSQQACEFPVAERAEEEALDAVDLAAELKAGGVLVLNPYVRLNFSRAGSDFQVFIDGHARNLSNPLLPDLCLNHRIDPAEANMDTLVADGELMDWLAWGYRQSYWLWQDELVGDEESEDE